MRAFLDPGFKREFAERAPRDAESLPRIDARQFRPRKLPAGLKDASDLQQLAAARPTLQPRKHTSRAAVAKSRRADWQFQVREFLRKHDVKSAHQDWELPKADERVLLEWFEGLDVDKSGEVDADEVRALLAANGTSCSYRHSRIW